MDNEKEIQALIESFVEYRNLFTPIEQNLRDFAQTYNEMREEVQKLNRSFDSNMQSKLDGIVKELSNQFEKSKNLTAQFENFKQKTDGFVFQMEKLTNALSNIGDKIEKIDKIEEKATSQIDKLNDIIEKKNKVYDVKQLEKNLENYNVSVQKVSDYINKDIAVALSDNNEKIESIKDTNESVYQVLLQEKSGIDKLIEAYSESNLLLKNLLERQDVNEQYIFDLFDKWAKDRKVKTKK